MHTILARLRALPVAARVTIAVFILAVAAGGHWFANSNTTAGPTSLRDRERFVFISARDSSEIAVIDAQSNRVVARVVMPAAPKQLLMSEPTGILAMTSAGSSGLDIVELMPETGRARIDLGIEADSILLSPDGYLVAAHNAAQGALVVASLQTRKRLFSVNGFSGTHYLTYSYDGSQIYVVNAATAELAVFDLVQQKVIEKIKLGGTAGAVLPLQGASALTRTPDGRNGFVAIAGGDKVIAIDLGNMKIAREIRVGSRPSRPYATADARIVLVSNDGDRTVSVIDSATIQVLATLPGAADVNAINTGWFETFAFVTSSSEKRIVVLDLEKFRKVADIELPSPALTGMVNSAGVKLFAPLKGGGLVAVIDTRRHAVQTLVADAGALPWAVAMAHSNNYCH